MVVECIAITAIIIAICIIFLRARRKDYALATMPMAIVPLFQVWNIALGGKVAALFSADPMMVLVLTLIAGAAISCAFVGMVTMRFFKVKRSRVMYMALTLFFNIALVMILVRNTIRLVG